MWSTTIVPLEASLTIQLDEAKQSTPVVEVVDDEFIDLLKSRKIASIPEKMVTDITTFNYTVGTALFMYAMLNFSLIQSEMEFELNDNVFYLCNVDQEIRNLLSYEAAGMGSEAATYTTGLIVASTVIAALSSLHQGLKYPFIHSEKRKLSAQLKAHQLKIDSSITSLHISNQQLKGLQAFIESTVADERDLVESILKIYFSDLEDKQELNKLLKKITETNLVSKVKNILESNPETRDIKSGTLEKFAREIQWYGKEIANYRFPVAMLFAIPGFTLMLIAASKTYKDTDCSLFNLINEGCSGVELYEEISTAIFPSLFIPLSIMGFQAAAMVFYGLTKKHGRHEFYLAVHKHYKDWLASDTWRYKNLVWEILRLPVLPAIFYFSFTTAVRVSNRYADEIGCESIDSVINAILFGGKEDIFVCSASQRSMALSGFAVIFELKAYALYNACKLSSYTLTHLLGNNLLTKCISNERADVLNGSLTKIHNRSFKFAFLVAALAGASQLLNAQRFAEDLLGQGIQVLATLPANTTIPVDGNITAIFDRYCTYSSYDEVMNNGIFPNVSFINNSLLLDVENACPQYSIYGMFMANFLSTFLWDCSSIIEYRSIAAFLAVVTLSVTLSGGGAYCLANMAQILEHMVLALKNYCGAEPESEEVPDNADAPAQQVQARPPQGCFAGLYGFFNRPQNDAQLQNNLNESLLPASGLTN